jgi:hypothetical protein
LGIGHQEAEAMSASIFFNAIVSDEPTPQNEETAIAFAAFSAQASEMSNVTALQTTLGKPGGKLNASYVLHSVFTSV